MTAPPDNLDKRRPAAMLFSLFGVLALRPAAADLHRALGDEVPGDAVESEGGQRAARVDPLIALRQD